MRNSAYNNIVKVAPKWSLIILIIPLLLSCSFFKNVIKIPLSDPDKTIKVIYKHELTEEEAKKLKINDGDDKKFWIVTASNDSKVKMKISFRDFKIFSLAYRNWRIVEGSDPIITKIEDSPMDIVITYSYIKTMKDENGIEYKGSVLSGKFYINKKYIKDMKLNANPYLLGGFGATLVYAIVVTIIIL